MKRFLLVIGLLAATLTIVSTSSATVRALITGKDVKDGSLSSADIANGSLQAKDLAPAVLARMSSNGTVGAPGIAWGPAGSAGPTGPTGATGATGATGSKGDTTRRCCRCPGRALRVLQGAKGDTGAAGANGTRAPLVRRATRVPLARRAHGCRWLLGKGDAGADGATGARATRALRVRRVRRERRRRWCRGHQWQHGGRRIGLRRRAASCSRSAGDVTVCNGLNGAAGAKVARRCPWCERPNGAAGQRVPLVRTVSTGELTGPAGPAESAGSGRRAGSRRSRHGAQGLKGDKGDQGDQGDQGPSGTTSILAASLDTAVAIDSDGETVVSLTLPARAASYLLMAKLNLVSQSGATAHCSIDADDGGDVDSIKIRLGSEFDTSNYLVLPHAYTGGSAAPALKCSAEVGGTFTVKSARIVAIESQTLSIAQ